ncbi:MAG TPA: hypothetical protein VM537_33065 [Anaerolineae bacterium]|nr:hypothetical protein [Anaerolineae bacterium]
MLQWFADNAQGLVALLTIAAAIVSLITKAGLVQKARGDMLTQVLEDSAGVATRIVSDLNRAKRDGELTSEEIGNAIAKGLKGEARERAFKTGFKSLVGAVADGAAGTDPDPDKKPRSAAQKLMGLLRPRLFGG